MKKPGLKENMDVFEFVTLKMCSNSFLTTKDILGTVNTMTPSSVRDNLCGGMLVMLRNRDRNILFLFRILRTKGLCHEQLESSRL